jgi:exosortase A
MSTGSLSRPQDHRLRESWRVALPVMLLVVVVILAAYWETCVRIVSIWTRSQTFTHGFLVVPIVAWLIWRKRTRLAEIAPHPDLRALPLVILAGLAWLLGELTATNAVTFLALVTLLLLAVVTVLGLPVARAIAFPLFYTYFAVPVGEFVMPQMMGWTADFTVQALVWTGIPVYREGQQFVIPSGSWSVVEACSGVRYLIASVVVGTLYAYLNYRSLGRRLTFIGVSIVVPIVANWLRAYLIVMLGHLSGNKLAVGVDHIIYGWVFFGVVMLMMFWIGARWSEHTDVEAAVPSSVPGDASVSPSRLWVAAAAIVAVAVLPHAWLAATERAAVRHDGAPPQLNLAAPAGWQSSERSIQWRPAYAHPTAETQAEFTSGTSRVGIFIGYYHAQDYEHKLIASTNALVHSSDANWLRTGSASRSITIDGASHRIRTAELRGPGARRLIVWQWYWIDGKITASDHLAKVWQAVNRLMGKGDDSVVVILYAPEDTPGNGESALESFVQAASGDIASSLRQVR